MPPIIISKECFPPAQECANCDRKYRYGLISKAESKELQRCAGCHLLAYCDKDCQREHWIKVHKDHCKYLSGKKIMENSLHVADSCSSCIEARKTRRSELFSCDSPKAVCHSETAILVMKQTLGSLFKFHREGKRCNCLTIASACELPFPLGEVSGQYVGTGLDEMLAHAFKLLITMKLKGGMDESKQEKVANLLGSVIVIRANLWREILIRGNEVAFDGFSKKQLDLKSEYGSGNAWWEAVSFTMDFIQQINTALAYNLFAINTDILKDSRFLNFKLVQLYYEAQRRNIKFISQNNLWIKFKLWPVVSEDSMKIILPDQVRCSVCKASLSGPISFLQQEDNPFPILTSSFGEVEGLVACCPLLSCVTICYNRNTIFRMKRDNRLETLLEEKALLISTGRICDFCLKQSLSCHRCSECCAAQYCSTSCQNQDLDFHKTVCKAWSKDESRKLISGRKQRKIYKSRVEEQMNVNT